MSDTNRWYYRYKLTETNLNCNDVSITVGPEQYRPFYLVDKFYRPLLIVFSSVASFAFAPTYAVKKEHILQNRFLDSIF